MYSTHFLYCLITLIVEDLSAYAYFFIEKKVGAERTRIEMYPLYWTPSKEGTFCVIRLNLS